jgi:hypothetical protein
MSIAQRLRTGAAHAPRHRLNILRLVPAACVVLLVAAAVPAQPLQAPDGGAIRTVIERASLPQLRRPDFADLRQALDDYYREGGYAPQWLSSGAPWRAGLAELAAAPDYGLDAKDYDVDWIGSEMEAITVGGGGPRAGGGPAGGGPPAPRSG